MAAKSRAPEPKQGVIGKGIRITGKLRGGEDLVIQGRIEGSIALEDNHLVLERSAVIKANAEVKNITVRGEMHGNSLATEKVELSEEAKVVGDIKAPRLVMRDGAKFRGSVDMAVPLPPGVEPIARTNDTDTDTDTDNPDNEWQAHGRLCQSAHHDEPFPMDRLRGVGS